MQLSNKDILSKWERAVEGIFGKINIELIKNICLYCEWHESSSYSKSCVYYYELNYKYPNLIDKLKEIKEKLNNVERIDIVGKSVNVITGEIEYKLSNGEYIPLGGKNDFILTDKQLISIFGIEFVKYLDLEIFRDFQINEILNETDRK